MTMEKRRWGGISPESRNEKLGLPVDKSGDTGFDERRVLDVK
jgi:hypothetical protein